MVLDQCLSRLQFQKLHRLKNHDVGDIVAMHNTGRVDLSKFPLTQKHIDDYHEVITKYS